MNSHINISSVYSYNFAKKSTGIHIFPKLFISIYLCIFNYFSLEEKYNLHE